jgi:hypothetical protein
VAKKQQQHVSVTFNFSEGKRILEDAIYKQITLKQGSLRFFHIERKGNTWLVLDALEFVEEGCQRFCIPFIKDTGAAIPHNVGFTIGETGVKIQIYTTLNLQSDELYHLDELPDGTWRVTHTNNMFEHPHNDLYAIIVGTN